MTLSDLLSNSPDKLEKLTDEELKSILAPYFIVTRPDESKRKPMVSKSAAAKKGIERKSMESELDKKMKLAEEKMKAMGL